MERWYRWFVPMVIFGSLYALLSNERAADPDFFARVAVGRSIAVTGWVLERDPFSFLSEKSLWIDHEWLSGYIFYSLLQFGEPALWYGKWFCAALFIGILASAFSARLIGGVSRANYLFGMLTAVFGSFYLWTANVRCQVFTALGFAILMLVFRQYEARQKTRLLWLLPLMFVLWSNLHGGWVYGWLSLFVFSGVQVFCERKHLPLLLVTILCLFVTLINPWGYEYWRYLFHALRMERTHILEWQSVPPFSPVGLMLLFSSLLISLGSDRYRERPAVYALGLLLLVGAFSHLRLVGYFFLCIGVLFSREMVEGAERLFRSLLRLRKFSSSGIIIVVELLLFCSSLLAVVNVSKGFQGFQYSFYPVRAVDWLWTSGYQGKLLVEFNYGSFALWRLYPKLKVSSDGRYEEVYRDETVKLNRCALNQYCPEQREAVSQIDPDVILARKSQLNEPEQGSGYRKIYEDENFWIFLNEETLVPLVPGEPASMWQPRFGEEIRYESCAYRSCA